METVYTATEVSKLLKINYRKILDEITIGRLKACKIGKQYRVTKSNLKQYLEDNTVERCAIL
tara:strand:- start:524 stop:709 length:186 start_codon:yes stop_codon:yes gene_type:complete